jgi:hypothetical protein
MDQTTTRFTPIGRTVAAVAAGLTLGLAGQVWAAADPAAYKQAKDTAEATYDNAKKACDSMKDNAKDVCIAEAKAARDKTKAQAEAEYKATPKAQGDARLVAAKADYKVAVERCDDKSGNDKDVCVKDAKAARAKVEADVKAQREIKETRQETAQTKMEASYKAALERCESLSGNAKESCVALAKSTYKQ